MCWGVNTHMTDGEGGLVPQGWDRVYNDEGESGASQLSVPPSPTPFPSSPSLILTIILVLAFFCIPENTEEWGIYFWTITVHTSYWNSLWIISFFWIISDHTPTHVKVLLDPEKKPEIVNAGTPDQPSQADSLGKTEQTHLLGGGSTT